MKRILFLISIVSIFGISSVAYAQFLLKEDGAKLLKEDSGSIYLESFVDPKIYTGTFIGNQNLNLGDQDFILQ